MIFKLYAVWDGVVGPKTYFSSFPMFILLVVSIILIALVIERFIAYNRRREPDANRIVKETLTHLREGDVEGALKRLGDQDTPIRNVLRVGLQNAELPPEEVEKLMYARILNEKDRLTQRLTPISVISVLAPLLGLFGTVDGLIHAFHEIAVTGTGGPEVVGEGISTSLVATWTGLIIAVLAVIFFNVFNRNVDVLVSRIEAAVQEFLVILREYQATRG
jgi:biopolymer transport protein ExbB